MSDSKIYNILVITAYLVPVSDMRSSTDVRHHISDFIRMNYGSVAVVGGIGIYEDLSSQFVMLESNGREDAIYLMLREAGGTLANLSFETRMSLLAFFLGLCIKKKNIYTEKLHNVAILLGLDESEVDILLDMLYPQADESPKERALKVLELSMDATEEDIKLAYRRLSLIYHPDRNLDKSVTEQKIAEQKFKEIVAAKETLIQLLQQ